jgi:hypothetical protein
VAAHDASAILEVLEEEETRMVVEVNNGG